MWVLRAVDHNKGETKGASSAGCDVSSRGVQRKQRKQRVDGLKSGRRASINCEDLRCEAEFEVGERAGAEVRGAGGMKRQGTVVIWWAEPVRDPRPTGGGLIGHAPAIFATTTIREQLRPWTGALVVGQHIAKR